MNQAQIDAVCADLDAKKITAREAIARLAPLGAALAEETVFLWLGGSDVIQDDRYLPSGKTVAEVEAEMKK